MQERNLKALLPNCCTDDGDLAEVPWFGTRRVAHEHLRDLARESVSYEFSNIVVRARRSRPARIEVLDSRTPALGARIAARAWVDWAFRARLLVNGRTACEEEFGILDRYGSAPRATDAPERYRTLQRERTRSSCHPRRNDRRRSGQR